MRVLLGMILIVFAPSFLFAVNGNAPARTLSTSRQFVVYGPDARLRGAIAEVAERTKKIALDLLQERDQWKTPIVINARPPEANLPEIPPVEFNLSQTGFGLKLQLELRIDDEADSLAVQREILRAIFLEMIYRAAPDLPVGAPVAQPPDWLLDGALALVQARDSSAIFHPLQSVVASGKISLLEDFLRQKPELLDSPSRKIYRASAATFVSMLTDSPRGRMRLARFLADRPQATSDPLADLRSHFPSLFDDPKKSQESWVACLTRFAEHDRYRLLDLEQSDRQLAGLLRVEIRQPHAVFALEEFPQFIRQPEASAALQELSQRLVLFSSKANPLLRPVVAEYQQIIDLLARRKTKRLTERLAELRATREHIARRMNAIGDYLNWFEVTQSRTASGQFRDYLKAASTGEERAPRRDRISIYLDALEMEFGK